MMAMTLTPDAWRRFAAETERLGLGMVRAAPLAAVADLLRGEPPPARATHVVVVLQTGPRYWTLMRGLQQADPALAAHPDPLDTFTRRMAERLRGALDAGCAEVRFPFASTLDCVALGERLGVGARSRLKILIHPDYGPWMAFRMLFFVRDEGGVLPPVQPAPVNVCDGCAGPCVAACPAGALTGPAGGEKLDYMASFAYRVAHPGTCESACAARLACPVGAEHRYGDDFIAHSHRRAFAAGKAHLKAAATDRQGRLF